MTTEAVRALFASGFFLLLLLLRLEAERFGAAEFSESRWRAGFWTRLSWYLIAGLLLTAMYLVHPSPHDVLFFLVGHRVEAVTCGIGLTALGVGQAAVFAWFRYGNLRLPPLSAYPRAAFVSVGTAVVDEAMFRGAVLGTLLAVGTPQVAAILLTTLIYVLATRMAAPGHSRYMVLMSFGMGLAYAAATVATGGLGAAIMGHVATSFAIFVCTGHVGQVPRTGHEPEDLSAAGAMPAGWQDARRPSIPGRGAEPRDFAAQALRAAAPQAGFVDRAERRAVARRSGPVRRLLAAVQGLAHPSEPRGR